MQQAIRAANGHADETSKDADQCSRSRAWFIRAAHHDLDGFLQACDCYRILGFDAAAFDMSSDALRIIAAAQVQISAMYLQSRGAFGARCRCLANGSAGDTRRMGSPVSIGRTYTRLSHRQS